MTKLIKKRRIASESEVEFDLRHDLPLFKNAFEMGVDLYNKEITSTPPGARIKGFEASLLNAKMIQSLQHHFPDKFAFGKYKRVVGRFEGYQFLVKKLDRNSLPMNIKTKNTEAIINQLQLSLFDQQQDVADALLFFGYKRDRYGMVHDPQIVCIDEGRMSWSLDLNKFGSNTSDSAVPVVTMPTLPTSSDVQIRKEKISENRIVK